LRKDLKVLIGALGKVVQSKCKGALRKVKLKEPFNWRKNKGIVKASIIDRFLMMLWRRRKIMMLWRRKIRIITVF